jgi:hypothetical protein
MGYSIYDYYGMANDLQNRYDAAKNAGRSATTGATGLSFNTNAPFKTQPESTQTTTASVPTQQQASIYDTTGNDGGYSPSGYQFGDLVNNPSAPWTGSLNASIFGLAAPMALGGYPTAAAFTSYGLGQLFDYGQGKWSPESALTAAAKSAASYGLNQTNIVGNLTKGISSNPMVQGLTGMFGKQGIQGAINSVIDLLSGNFLNTSSKNTIGNPEEDPFLASSKMNGGMSSSDWGKALDVPSWFGIEDKLNDPLQYAPGGIYNKDIDQFPTTGGLAMGPSDTERYELQGMLGDPYSDPYSYSGETTGGEGSGSPSDNSAGWDWY